MASWSRSRTAIVTGGGSGIGLAISRRLAIAGASVAIVDLDPTSAEAAAAGIVAEGGRAFGAQADVTDRSRIEAVVGEVVERLGAPAILVNNAGRPSFAPFLDITGDHWDQILDVNLTGTFHCTQVVLPHMLDAGWGRIVNISSSSMHTGVPGMSAYVAAKAGVVGLTKSLALEFGARGITVNTIPPGSVETPMLAVGDAWAHLSVEEQIRYIPVGRRGLPEDIAAACEFLCRDEASYITGQVFGVDGGRHM